MFNKKVLLKIAANTLLGVFLIGIWLKFVNIEEVIEILKKADFKIVFVFLLFFVVSTLLRALRLKILLSHYKIPLKDIIMMNLLGQFLSFMIPIRAGEIAKSVYLTSQYKAPLGKAVIWVLVDRFLDFWTVLLLISIFLISVPSAIPPQLTKSIFIFFGLFTLIFLLVVKSENISKQVINLVSKVLVAGKVKDWFVKFTHNLVDGFEILRRNPVELSGAILLTVLATISDSLIWFSIFNSLGIDLTIPRVILGNSLTALTFLIPAAPGYVGSAEAGVLAVFSGVLGISNNLVSAAAVLFHIITVVLLLVFGITSLYILKFDLGQVWSKLRKQ